MSAISLFSENLAQFPIDLDSPPTLAGGYWDATATNIAQEHVFISARPLGLRGHVALLVRLAVPNGETDSPAIKYSASVVIETDYGGIDEMRMRLEHIARGESREMTLVFER